MNRSTVALGLVALLCSGSLAQEREARTEEYQGREDVRERSAVEDPAGFNAEGEQIFSGPQPGEKLPAFKATSLEGDREGEELGPITSAGGERHVLFFQDVSRVAMAGLFPVMDAIGTIERKAGKELQVACVFLTDDPAMIPKGYARGFAGLRERGIDLIAVSKDGREGPGAYGLNRNVTQTIILARNGKVTRNFVFREGTLYTDPHVIGGIAELIDEDRATVAGWLAQADGEAAQMRMRRENDPQSAAKAKLRRKLAEFVRAGKITREESSELYQAAFPESR